MATQLKAVGGSLMAIIPAEIVRELGLTKGQLVDVSTSRGAIVIRPVSRPDWASYFAREMNPEIANYEFKREEFEDRNVFGDRENVK